MKIAFFGTPRLAQIVLENLVQSPYKPSLVVTAPDAKSGRGRKVTASAVKQTAQANKIEVRTRSDPARDSAGSDLDADLAILVAYGKLIPKEILDIPKYGFINMHPSLLPKYRGPSPIQTAILNGDKSTGVTIIKLDEELDHGPILAQKEVKIEKEDTHLSLIEKLGLIGSNLLLEVLPLYLAHSRSESKTSPQIHSGSVFLPLKPQNHKEATYTKKITKADGKIDLINPPNPLNLDRMIRAYYPWPTVWGEVRVEREKGKVIRVKLLPEKIVQVESKKPMTIKEFRNGYPQFALDLEKLMS